MDLFVTDRRVHRCALFYTLSLPHALTFTTRRTIQAGTDGHSSAEDAIATMDLVRLKLSKGKYLLPLRPKHFVIYVVEHTDFSVVCSL